MHRTISGQQNPAPPKLNCFPFHRNSRYTGHFAALPTSPVQRDTTIHHWHRRHYYFVLLRRPANFQPFLWWTSETLLPCIFWYKKAVGSTGYRHILRFHPKPITPTCLEYPIAGKYWISLLLNHWNLHIFLKDGKSRGLNDKLQW